MTKLYKTQHTKEHCKQQHCPICNRYVKYEERYQNYVCKKCALLTTDKAGKQVAFFNITTSGHGIQGKYKEAKKLYRSTICYIKGIKCRAEEAYFGGIVILLDKKRKRNSDFEDGQA